MLGIALGFIVIYGTVFSTFFFVCYAGLVAYKVLQKEYDLYRVGSALLISFLLTPAISDSIFLSPLPFLFFSLVLHILLLRYLSSLRRETLLRPRNFLLRLRFHYFRRLSPTKFALSLIFSILLLSFALLLLLLSAL